MVTAQLEPNRVSTAQCRQMGGRGAPHDQGSLQSRSRLFLEVVTWEVTIHACPLVRGSGVNN